MKNVCQTCLLDLEFGESLWLPARDSACVRLFLWVAASRNSEFNPLDASCVWQVCPSRSETPDSLLKMRFPSQMSIKSTTHRTWRERYNCFLVIVKYKCCEQSSVLTNRSTLLFWFICNFGKMVSNRNTTNYIMNLHNVIMFLSLTCVFIDSQFWRHTASGSAWESSKLQWHAAQTGPDHTLLQEEPTTHLLLLGEGRVQERRGVSLQVSGMTSCSDCVVPRYRSQHVDCSLPLFIVILFTQTREAHRSWWSSGRPEHQGPLLRHQWSSGWQAAEAGLDYAAAGSPRGQDHQHTLHRRIGRYRHRWRSEVRLSVSYQSNLNLFTFTLYLCKISYFGSNELESVLLQESLLPVWWDSNHHHSPKAAVRVHPVCNATVGWNGGWEVLQQTHY